MKILQSIYFYDESVVRIPYEFLIKLHCLIKRNAARVTILCFD